MSRKKKQQELEPEKTVPTVYPMTYFRCNDGIGGTKSNNFTMISAIHMTQQFVQCTEAEYEEAVTRYNARKVWDQMMKSPSLK